MSFSFIRQHETDLLQGWKQRWFRTPPMAALLLLQRLQETRPGVMSKCVGGTFLLGQMGWEGDRDGRGHISSHAVSSFLGTRR